MLVKVMNRGCSRKQMPRRGLESPSTRSLCGLDLEASIKSSTRYFAKTEENAGERMWDYTFKIATLREFREASQFDK